jgi:hypothetical protein
MASGFFGFLFFHSHLTAETVAATLQLFASSNTN